ncbi:MAG: hypothetical protein KDE19_07350, partial [Caldilineaceae bacterium]|nr:hypothetical protein [Caldilineaceae bacterium]
MQTMAEEWIEEGKVIGRKEGEEKGRKEGEEKGRKEGIRVTIVQILQRRFTADEAQFARIAQQLAQVEDESVLNALVNAAFDILVLPDFMTRLNESLPVSE